MTEKKLVSLTTYVSPETKQKILKLADSEDRSVSYLIGKILENAVAEKKPERERND